MSGVTAVAKMREALERATGDEAQHKIKVLLRAALQVGSEDNAVSNTQVVVMLRRLCLEYEKERQAAGDRRDSDRSEAYEEKISFVQQFIPNEVGEDEIVFVLMEALAPDALLKVVRKELGICVTDSKRVATIINNTLHPKAQQ